MKVQLTMLKLVEKFGGLFRNLLLLLLCGQEIQF